MFGEHQNNLDFIVFTIWKKMEHVTILNTEFLQTACKTYVFLNKKFSSCRKNQNLLILGAKFLLSIRTKFQYFLWFLTNLTI